MTFDNTAILQNVIFLSVVNVIITQGENMPKRTLAIIKPDAFSEKNAGKIIDIIQNSGFNILAMKVLKLSEKKAAEFYDIHTGKPFFEDLVSFMTSGKIVVLALEAGDAVNKWRSVMGATNPADAEDGTVRKLFGKAVNRNASHGSDADETATREIAFFFDESELVS